MALPDKKMFVVHIPALVEYTVIVEANDSREAIDAARPIVAAGVEISGKLPTIHAVAYWHIAEVEEMKPSLPFAGLKE